MRCPQSRRCWSCTCARLCCDLRQLTPTCLSSAALSAKRRRGAVVCTWRRHRRYGYACGDSKGQKAGRGNEDRHLSGRNRFRLQVRSLHPHWAWPVNCPAISLLPLHLPASISMSCCRCAFTTAVHRKKSLAESPHFFPSSIYLEGTEGIFFTLTPERNCSSICMVVPRPQSLAQAQAKNEYDAGQVGPIRRHRGRGDCQTKGAGGWCHGQRC